MSSSVKPTKNSKSVRTSSQHGSRSTVPQQGGAGSSSSSSADVGSTPQSSSSSKTKELLAKGTRPRVTPSVTPGVAVPDAPLALQDALPGELDVAAAVANPNVIDIPLVNPDPQTIAQQPAGNGVDAAFIKVFQYARKCVEFDPTKVSVVFKDVETLMDKASWKTIVHCIIHRLLPFQGFPVSS